MNSKNPIFRRRYRTILPRQHREPMPTKRKACQVKRNPKDYTSIFATHLHQPITDVKMLKKWDYNQMGFFYKGGPIGDGELHRMSRASLYVHTDSVAINKKHRKQGHGIHLYRHLIDTAIRIGAHRIYSSTSLNKFSKRMWRVKLKQFYDVKEVTTRKPCRECDSCVKRTVQYYIQLK